MWITIKTNPNCTNGTKHVMETIIKTPYISENMKKIVNPGIQRNAFFVDSKNMLLCMLSDQTKIIRELGYRQIVKARTSNRKKVRQFIIPQLNFEATSYENLLDWTNLVVTKPPLLTKLEDDELEDIVEVGFKSHLPCHTQGVGRCVKLVAEALEAKCGAKDRDGFIRSRLASQKKMPCFETKEDSL